MYATRIIPAVAALVTLVAGTPVQAQTSGEVTVHANARDTYDLLDPTTNITRKDLVLLRAARDEGRGETTLTVGAAMTGLMNAQQSNRAGKFGYLMRHPTSNNQAGQSASEAVLHSAQLRVTGTAGSWITAHMEFLYDPEQSFGQGTITAPTRNQVQLRHGVVLLGNLKKSPVYASLGKMAVPFGLMDTVNPFTASTVWHAFGGLAFGGRIGYQSKGLGVSFMAIQGGAQFRAAHAPVEGTAIPSRTNNFSVDVNYTFGGSIRTLTDQKVTNRALVGASYIHGSAYCQGFPVVHFQSCDERNPAYDFYGQLNLSSRLTIQGEFAKTTGVWPGTFNPALPQFAAQKVSSFALGGKFRAMADVRPVDVSMEFSRFTAGPTGAPWDDQDQVVLGVSVFVFPSVRFFGEYINVRGYAPLNFISGGGGPDVTNPDGPETHSDNTARSHVGMFGMTAAF